MLKAIARKTYTFECPECKKDHHVGIYFFRHVKDNDFTCKECGNLFSIDLTNPVRCRQYC